VLLLRHISKPQVYTGTMIIWIIRPSEPTPYDAKVDNRRLGRYSHLAFELAKEGHEVLWWTDDFDHLKKVHRFGEDHFCEVAPRISVQWLHTPGYLKNMSFRRFRDHQLLARKIDAEAAKKMRPDLILCCMPTDTLCKEAVILGERFQCPVVLDVRDLWPDVFYGRVPLIIRPLLYLYTTAMRRRLSFAFSRAQAILGTSPGFVKWGLSYAGRKRMELDQDFPICSPLEAPSEKSTEQAFSFWNEHGIRNDGSQFVVSFMGAFSSMYRFDALVEAARILKEERRIRFVFCGTGPLEKYIREKTKDLPNVILPGWIHYPEVWSLLKMSNIGLCPYVDDKNFSLNMPNKPGEYITAGLPILSSIDGYLGQLLKTFDCGFVYKNGHDLAKLLILLSGDQSLHHRLCENTKRLFSEKFDPSVVYCAMRTCLETVAAKKMTLTVGSGLK